MMWLADAQNPQLSLFAHPYSSTAATASCSQSSRDAWRILAVADIIMHEQVTREVVPVTCRVVAGGALLRVVGVVHAAVQEVERLLAEHRAADADERLAPRHQLLQYLLVAVLIQNALRLLADG